MRFPALVASLLAPSLAAQSPAPAGQPAVDEAAILEAAASRSGRMPHQIDRGEGLLPLFVPWDEELVFDVDVAWGVIGAALGTVTMSAGVEEYRTSLLVANAPVEASGTNGEEIPPPMTCWMKAHAYGKHLLYTMDATLEARHQPQEWPRIVYHSTQKGSEERRRELLLGFKEEKAVSSYRRDTSTGAPRGTRIWRDPELRDIPAETLDMTSAVYLVRTFIMRGLERTEFPVIQKRKLWAITLELGEVLVHETPAGRFDAVEVILNAARHPDDLLDVDDEDEGERFEGLFGLRGSIHLWVERHTGVPVRVQGEVPAGPLTLDVDISLSSFRGTPRAFQVVPPGPGE